MQHFAVVVVVVVVFCCFRLLLITVSIIVSTEGIINNFFGVKVGTFKEPETLKLYMCFRLP